MADDITTRKGYKKGLSELYAESESEASAFSEHLTESQKKLDYTLQGAAKHLDTIDDARIEAERRLDIVTSKANTVDNKFTNFQTLTNGINSPRNGIAVKLKKIEDSAEQSTEYEESAKKSRDESLVAKNEIDAIKITAKKSNDDLDVILTDSKSIKDDIQKTYKLATDLGLAGALFTRKSELNKLVYLWLAGFLVFGIVTVVIISFIIHEGQGQPLQNFLSRLLFITPSLALAFFSYNQYKNERRLLEEYAFRAAMAQSIESYTQLLSREFNNDEYREKILGFVLGSMRTIYDRASLDNPQTYFQFGLKSHFASLETVMKEQANSINQNIDDATEKIEDAVTSKQPLKKSSVSP